jgi:hypothetical protein
MFGFATANPKHAFEALEAHFRKKKILSFGRIFSKRF